MDNAGVKGVRFNFIKRLVDFTPRDVLERIAARIAPLGWHIVIYFEHADLPEMGSFFTVAADHGGGRPHGTPEREEGRRRTPRTSASNALDGEPQEFLGQRSPARSA